MRCLPFAIMSAVPSATISQEKNQICLVNLRHLKAVEQSSWNTPLMQNARLVKSVFPAFDGDVDGTLKFSHLNCERWHSIQTHTAPQLLIESATGRCGGSGVSKTTSCQDCAETSTKTSLQHYPPLKIVEKHIKTFSSRGFFLGHSNYGGSSWRPRGSMASGISPFSCQAKHGACPTEFSCHPSQLTEQGGCMECRV